MFLGRIHDIKANLAWLIGDRLFRMGVGLLVLGLVARHLGTSQFGQLNYAINLTLVFASVASLGIEGIVIRELVKAPSQQSRILGTAWVMRLVGALGAILCLAALRALGVEQELSWILLLVVSLVFLPQSFEVIDLFFQKNIQSKYTVMAKTVALFIGAGVKIGLVIGGSSLFWFGFAFFLDGVLNAVALVLVFMRRGHDPLAWTPSLQMARKIFHDSWPLMLSGLLVGLYARVEQFLVRDQLGDDSLGIYYASVRITEMWGFIPTLILSTLYPLLVEAKRLGQGDYPSKVQFVFDLLTGIGYVVALGALLFAPLIPLIFGKDFNGAVTILMIHAWTAPVVFSGSVRAQYFLLENLTVYHTVCAVVGIIFNVGLTLWLMPKLGAKGAALGALVGYWVSAHALSLLLPQLRWCGWAQTRAFLLPFRLRSAYRNFQKAK